MASEIKVDTIVNAGGDNDSGIDLSTNDVVKVNIAGSEKARVHSDGKVGIGTTSPTAKLAVSGTGTVDLGIGSTNAGGAYLYLDGDSNGDFSGSDYSYIGHDTSGQLLIHQDSPSGSDNILFKTNATERMRIDSNGHLLIGTTSVVGTGNNTNEHVELRNDGVIVISKNAGVGLAISRGTDDGTLVQLQQGGTVEGTIDVSGTTVTYNGFAGSHESSGIPTNTPIGTVVSTIDELDVYFAKQEGVSGEENNPKAGQTRADHAKVKVSDTAGDKAVYGVVGSFNAQGKVNVASVGIGSVRVTGACAKGDLLESNGDGTAKVQSDDIVRSKTIGKVTIGNSNTGVKLVSCVLYCG
mgnify:CR=1 FL=1